MKEKIRQCSVCTAHYLVFFNLIHKSDGFTASSPGQRAASKLQLPVGGGKRPGGVSEEAERGGEGSCQEP